MSKFKPGDVFIHKIFVGLENPQKWKVLSVNEYDYTLEGLGPKRYEVVYSDEFQEIDAEFVLYQPYLNEKKMKELLGIK